MPATSKSPPPRFSLGLICLSRGVHDAVEHDPALGAFLRTSLQAHAAGDWGRVDDADRAANDQALRDGSRLLSSYGFTFEVEGPYGTEHGGRIWIITEADRSATTLLFPIEY